jgi:chromosome segregation ATPase
LNDELKNININLEKNDLKLKVFRKEEIEDLSKAVEANEKATNEHKMKREKLMVELERIEEETFELEKKYGKVEIDLNVESDPASSEEEEKVNIEEEIPENEVAYKQE